MGAASITAQTFKLFRVGTATSLAAVVTYNDVLRRATLNLARRLRPGVIYRVVVTTAVTDLAGNPLDQNSGVSGRQQKVFAVSS